jgi:hypothetical protein
MYAALRATDITVVHQVPSRRLPLHTRDVTELSAEEADDSRIWLTTAPDLEQNKKNMLAGMDNITFLLETLSTKDAVNSALLRSVLHDVAGMFNGKVSRGKKWYPRDALYRTLGAVSVVAPQVLSADQCSAMLGQCVMGVMNRLARTVEELVPHQCSAMLGGVLQCMRAVSSVEGLCRALPPSSSVAFLVFAVLRVIDRVNDLALDAEIYQTQLLGQIDKTLQSSAGILGQCLRLDPDEALVTILADRLEDDADRRRAGRGSRTVAYSHVQIAWRIALHVLSFPGVHHRTVPLLVRVACDGVNFVLNGLPSARPSQLRLTEAATDVLAVLARQRCPEIRQLLRVVTASVVPSVLELVQPLIASILKGRNRRPCEAYDIESAAIVAIANAVETAALLLADELSGNAVIIEPVLLAVLDGLPYLNHSWGASPIAAAIQAVATLLSALESANPQQHVALRRSVAQAASRNRHAKKHLKKRLRAFCRFKTQRSNDNDATATTDTKRTRHEAQS